nr:Chain B1, Nup53/Nup59 R3 [Saccharomyces cerevisiae]7TBI_B2 Chain B2, Nup53/Nup59 R3 [Saccharomyces cerevisiae]7TBI_B3 Chain B3, Nup53/Nup59 R3 [Saccharomyces cerevisiae]7TBI_B4 Chain B4, Nup53/Nup59 R3 [Saccharomyces cerevisiae]7TBJ_B1 Chain B1, NUP53 R3 [Homo sapiens]7TBJ_B2 Chain B2, NUP53 R3 [Homo sapiens]7TBJ_B3 Chain B3, NUP53 R3 [Homo sapiens]7TBJ_B4 Chain B4, NUP53 R3 [Homo sapiens]7TBJ_B5 Chain B5, NUP53 R3 [Homo sapiens]7TBJ_B6 Chain B6, NUP53 R3 [Homo sapiens]7TBK_B1 Chain B1
RKAKLLPMEEALLP